MIRDRMLKRLTDVYNKNPNSNIGKIISIVASQMDSLTSTFERIERWRGIDEARGTTLDNIGKNVDQLRGQTSDEVYRILIKSKIARNLSTGDINTIINILALSIDTDPSEIRIQETWNDPDDPEPAGIKLIQVPISRLNEVGMTGAQFGRIVSLTVAAGVHVREIDLQGTFEFGSINEEVDYEKGFGNIDQTIGGYLGSLYQPANDIDVPV
ncbi:hypothetical protein M3689_05540 [Alkalihalophilus marmarensis]|uniref:hypothetical protein n=1 Tax=Alkalihalophilus marmarensis TaxID=521377 RepID=UPI002040118D|nr:hypothetical protein [Alkalihalophilus marmarensis]MCM3488769.1 hypothetical protein [Alkalihalophilus marmarensis]